MDKRYLVEEVRAYGPDDAGWEPSMDFDDVSKAEEYAKDKAEIAERGSPGVRVFDTIEQKIIWSNCDL